MDINDALFHQGEGLNQTDLPASPPIYQTSNFIFDSVDDMRNSLKHEDEIPFYTRGANPTVKILQQKIAALEGTERAMIFASGSAAVAAAVISQVRTGDHIVCVDNPYSWTKKLISSILNRFGVKFNFVPADNTEGILAAIKSNTRVVYLESPNSWTYEMQDIEKVTKHTRERGIRTIIDNSCASPLYQQPVQYGVDIVVHSATKYLAGHSDVVAGVLCTSDQLFKEIFKNEYMTLGGIISPFDAWLMLRSLRTLEIRMEKISKNALLVAEFLEKSEKVETLFYTHSSNYPQPELRDRYLKGAGGLMTIDLKTQDPGKIEQFCNQLTRFKLGCSWGGYESLAFPAITTVDSLNYDNAEVKTNRIRLYIGLEDPALLIDDLSNAFKQI